MLLQRTIALSPAPSQLVLFARLCDTHQLNRRALSSTPPKMAPRPVPLARSVCDSLGLSPTELAFREGSATIVLPSKEAAFLNPVQEFNRDVSTLAIRAWSEQKNEERMGKYKQINAKKMEKKRRKLTAEDEPGPSSKKLKAENGITGVKATEGEINGIVAEDSAVDEEDNEESAPAAVDGDEAGQDLMAGFRNYRFTLLEALSATGLRSIRYAREIPLLRWVCRGQ